MRKKTIKSKLKNKSKKTTDRQKRNVPVLSLIEQREQEDGREKPQKWEGERLTPRERNFITEYMKTSNATRSFMKAYECENYDTSSTAASVLLKKHKIQEKIRQIQESNEIDESFVMEGLKRIATDPLMSRSPKGAGNSVRAFELLGKQRGLFKESFQHEFTGDNPCVVMIPVTAEETKEILKNGKRIEE